MYINDDGILEIHAVCPEIIDTTVGENSDASDETPADINDHLLDTKDNEEQVQDTTEHHRTEIDLQSDTDEDNEDDATDVAHPTRFIDLTQSENEDIHSTNSREIV